MEPRFAPHGALDPLALLELGVHEKLSRRWDYALVIVPNDLVPRDRLFALGVPSSVLEVAVMSSARLGAAAQLAERLAALALHLLGHLWGLDHAKHGPMRPPADEQDLYLVPFPEEQRTAFRSRFAEAADTRLEEQSRRWDRVSFYWNTLLVAPRELLNDIWDYTPRCLCFGSSNLGSCHAAPAGANRRAARASWCSARCWSAWLHCGSRSLRFPG